jgi:cytochrome oxidase assembly protein ShyY1
MNETSSKRGVAGFMLFTLLLTAAFVALGIWQLQRRTAKHHPRNGPR